MDGVLLGYLDGGIYHPLNGALVLLRLVLGWCTVDIILLNIRPLRLVLGWCTVDIILSRKVSAWMVHSGYHPPLRLVLGWCTVDIILLNIVLLG